LWAAEELRRTDLLTVLPADTLQVAFQPLATGDPEASLMFEHLTPHQFRDLRHRGEILWAYRQRLPRWAATPDESFSPLPPGKSPKTNLPLAGKATF